MDGSVRYEIVVVRLEDLSLHGQLSVFASSSLFLTTIGTGLHSFPHLLPLLPSE
jgi:hypothetical protein